jgi:hypothetical protein
MLSRRAFVSSLASSVVVLPFGILWPAHAEPGVGTLVVVTQKSSPLEGLSLAQLRRLYTSEPVGGPDGAHLIPLNHPIGTPVRVAFDQLVLKMSPDEAGRFWVDRRIRGQRGAPKAIPSLELLCRAVANLKGTITYLRASDVPDNVKVLPVEGKAPDQAGYPLQQ